ncbi:MAG: methyltransferase domain-containing protein [Novosphingobium sp.]
MSSGRADYHSLVRREVFHLIPRGGCVLDVGGGDGATAAALRASGHVARIGVVDRVAPAPGHRLDFAVQGDLGDPALLAGLGEREGPFDTILCLDVLEHFADPWHLVAQLHGLLAPGGCIVASIPNVQYYEVVLPLLLRGEWRYRDAGVLDRTHLRFFGRREAAQLLTSGGLRLDVIEPCRPGARRLRWANALSFGLLSGFLSQQFLLRVVRDPVTG